MAPYLVSRRRGRGRQARLESDVIDGVVDPDQMLTLALNDLALHLVVWVSNY